MSEKDIARILFEDPTGFSFFQAIRLLEKMYPDRDPLGRSSSPKNELIKIRGNPLLRFPPSEIDTVKVDKDDTSDIESAEIIVNFMGMIGIVGTLPTPYSETIINRRRYNDTALWSFTDIFTHRSVSMFYRAWEKYRFPVQYERGNDDFTESLFDLAGIGTRGLRESLQLDPEALLPYTGLILQKPHSAKAIEQIISDFFEVNAKTVQFYGQWLELDSESISMLGRKNSVLGDNAILGSRVWNQQSKFRLILGSMSFESFQEFLPNRTGNAALESILKLMTGLDLDSDVNLKLNAKNVPSCILTTRAKRKPMLGWTSWLKTKPFEEDDDQVVLQMT